MEDDLIKFTGAFQLAARASFRRHRRLPLAFRPLLWSYCETALSFRDQLEPVFSCACARSVQEGMHYSIDVPVCSCKTLFCRWQVDEGRIVWEVIDHQQYGERVR